MPIYTSASLEPGDPMDERAAMSLIDTRHDQMFPVLSIPQIETARRFASADARQFAPGELVFDVGERQAPAWLVSKVRSR